MKDIIFVSNLPDKGGAGRVMTILANYLSKEEYNTTICSFLPEEKERYQLNNKVTKVVLNSKSSKKIILTIKRIFELREIFKENEDATIVSFEYFVNMQVLIASLGLKNKVIVSERNDPAMVVKGKKIKKHIRNILYSKRANVLVCQTEDAKSYFNRNIVKKSIVIPNPIKVDLPKRHCGERVKEIVTYCRLEPQKNLKLLINAFKRLNKIYPEYKLSIYGEGSQREELLEHIKAIDMEKEININKFTIDIHDKVNKSAMFVLSSDYEGISNSMLEALGMGLPTVATDCPCGGCRMFIKTDYNGILVPVRDEQALFLAMKKVIDEPEFAEKISKNALAIRDEISEDKISKEWINCIERI